MISFLALFVNYVYYNEADNMERHGVRSNFVILGKPCFSKSGV
jgi:hypothetical protein